MLDRVERHYQDLKVIRITIPPKVTTLDGLKDILMRNLALCGDGSLSRELLLFDKTCEKKTLILVDSAHNLFISKIGGFEAYRAFLEIINLQTENLFWIASFNEYAYSYLQGVMGFAQYFREEIILGSWSHAAIEQLVLNRHDRTGFRLSFRKISPYAAHFRRADIVGSRVEDQFFGILWEQSNGNPRVAMHLWITSLVLKKNLLLEVGLPARALSGRMISLADNICFVLAAILRHGNLTKGEASIVCSLPKPTVSNALKLCLDGGFVHKGLKGRYSIDFAAHSEIITFLKTRNFVHGL
jgi:hypothetical protein